MANSYTIYDAKAGQQTFAVPFPYLQQADVQVYINGIQQLSPKDYVWLSNGSIQLFGSLIADAQVKLQRSTSPSNVLVTFANGATLSADELNEATLQNFYRTQELQDALDTYINGGVELFSINGSTVGLTPEEMIQAVAQSVLQTQLAQDLLQATDDIATSAQTILSNTNSINTINGIINGLTSPSGGLQTWIDQESTSRIAGDTALQQQLDLIGAANGSNTAFVLNQATTYVDSQTSLANYLAGITANFAANSAAITAEQTARVAADQANATAISNLQAQTVGTGGASLSSQIGNLQTVLSTQYSTSAQVSTAIQSAINTAVGSSGAVTSAIATALNTYTTSTSLTNAIATQVNGLQSSINGQIATIEANYVTTATLNGITSSEYTLKTDVNGHIAGFGLMNTGTASQFIVNANTFAIIDSTNSISPIVPFAVTGGKVYMQSVVINDAIIGSMSVGKLTQGSLNADMDVGTGRVIFDNGAFMMVEGVDFGVNSDLIMWFGAHQSSPSSCSRTNAKFYLANNGDSYFGGSFVTGVLTNSVQGSGTGVGSNTTLGPFNSEGNPITVTYSLGGSLLTTYPGTSQGQTQYNAAMAAYQTPSGTITLAESINGATYVNKSSAPLTGNHTGIAPIIADTEPGHISISVSGSGTYTTSGSSTTAVPHTYMVTVTAIGGSYPSPFNLSIQSSEA